MGFIPDGLRIASGRTPQGTTNWQVYTATGIFVDVDTSAGRLTKNPVYVTSIGGTSSHWATTGASSIYPIPPVTTTPTATGFRIYIRWVDNSPLTPAQANAFGWHINWIGYEQS